MCRYALIPPRGMFGLFAFLLGLTSSTPAAADARISENYGKLPLHFEANQGQSHQDVRFLSRGPGYSLYLTAGEAVLVLSRPNLEKKDDGRSTPGRRAAPAQAMPVAVRMSIVGAAPAPLVSGLEELPGKANYFIGKDPAQWRTNVPTYARVHYREVYPGIDLVYYGNQRQLEYDFVVAPGADPNKIVLGFKGADKVEIDANGDLLLHAAGGTLRQHKPKIYQETDGVRREIAGSYVRKSASRVGIKIAAYDRSRSLIIDPVLAYSTYLGGADYDYGRGIAVDSAGNAYVTGFAHSTDYPTTAGAFQSGLGGGIFVTKLNPTGTAIIYSTFLGGGSEESKGIAVDSAGSAYVTGQTWSSNFPTTPGAFQPVSGGGNGGDAFVTKLDPTGSALVYSTYLGGNSGDAGQGIAVDAAGNAYVTGRTESLNFPTTPTAFQLSRGCCGADAFVTKLNSTGSGLIYSTYLGGSDTEWGNGIAVDADGNAYVAGATLSTDFPTTLGAFQPLCGGGGACGGASDAWDAFITKLDPTGSRPVYSTFLGGSAGDLAGGIAVDADGNAYVTGLTNSSNFPTTVGAFQPTLGGATDAFVTRLNTTGSALVYSTYLGGSGIDQGNGIATDGAGHAYVTGETNSTNFSTTPGTFQPAYGDGNQEPPPFGPPHADAFLAQFSPTGSALFSTYLGGTAFDRGLGIAADTGGNVYVTGETSSANFPVTPGAFQTVLGGGGTRLDNPPDAFVAKFSNATRFEESAASYMGYWPSYGPETGTFSGGAIVASNQPTATATFTFTGTAVAWIGVKCNVCGIATVSIDGSAPTTVNTFGPGVPGSLVSEPVFTASGLAPDVTHTLVITVTGAATGGTTLLTGGSHIAVDAFDVTR